MSNLLIIEYVIAPVKNDRSAMRIDTDSGHLSQTFRTLPILILNGFSSQVILFSKNPRIDSLFLRLTTLKQY